MVTRSNPKSLTGNADLQGNFDFDVWNAVYKARDVEEIKRRAMMMDGSSLR
jgi:hypothetical protein